MEFSPRRPSLYRNRTLAVILAASTCLASSWLAAQGPVVQYGHKPAVDKGPRALGLIQLSAKGNKGRLIPVAIMMDGKFYDAGSYKATPVPMALDFDTVYEGFRTGVSQGDFTITQPGQLNHTWIAEGTWLPAGAKKPEKNKKYAPPVIEDKDAPPVLHRHSDKTAGDSGADSKDKDKDKNDKDKDKDKNKKKDQQKTAGGTTPPETAKSPEPAKPSAGDEPFADPNRPRLRRGKPDVNARREPSTTSFEAVADSVSAQLVVIPAISDAGGPDPRPYTYDLKPAEEAGYKSKMLDLASAQLRAEASAAAKPAGAQKAFSGKTAGKSAAKLPKRAFDDVKLRIFDLSSSNEPILVLSAKTQLPNGADVSLKDSFEPQEITLIARTNLEGELKKLFFARTDSRHLDATPRMELIDAVDADGDGRGELLFRRTFDTGSAYAIYRVTADGLWTLFEGTP
jgi:uncharacterized lipoprotein YbaY